MTREQRLQGPSLSPTLSAETTDSDIVDSHSIDRTLSSKTTSQTSWILRNSSTILSAIDASIMELVEQAKRHAITNKIVIPREAIYLYDFSTWTPGRPLVLKTLPHDAVPDLKSCQSSAKALFARTNHCVNLFFDDQEIFEHTYTTFVIPDGVYGVSFTPTVRIHFQSLTAHRTHGSQFYCNRQPVEVPITIDGWEVHRILFCELKIEQRARYGQWTEEQLLKQMVGRIWLADWRSGKARVWSGEEQRLLGWHEGIGRDFFVVFERADEGIGDGDVL